VAPTATSHATVAKAGAHAGTTAGRAQRLDLRCAGKIVHCGGQAGRSYTAGLRAPGTGLAGRFCIVGSKAACGGPTDVGGSQNGGTTGDGVLHGAGSRRHAVGGNSPASAGAASGLRRTLHVPSPPRPAPTPVLPDEGLTTGVPSAGSSSYQGGGAPAIVPVTTAAVTAAGNRPETAEDVEVRRLIVESPTVSPD
jgi:hypothetical protein